MHGSDSLALQLRLLPAPDRKRLLRQLSDEEALALAYDWPTWARPSQLPPEGPWTILVRLGGRGSGKTRSGAEWVRSLAEEGRARRIALVGPTAADCRDVMIEGESGILAVSPPWLRPRYEPSRRRVLWPNGATAYTYSADEPERLRGPQHDAAWCDEPASWRYPQAWDMLLLGLRLGIDPRVIVTGTPKPVKLILDLINDPRTVVTTESTFANKDNLPPAFFERIIANYQGTRLGRQEIYGELLEDLPGALWKRQWIDDARLTNETLPEMQRIVIGVDPAVTAKTNSHETGIVCCGVSKERRFYVLEDASMRGTPQEWAQAVSHLFDKRNADRVVCESNQGGSLVEQVLRTAAPDLPVSAIHARRSKGARAEPISALYEQGRVHHVGSFDRLEDQLCLFVPGQSGEDDRVDALVYALAELKQTHLFEPFTLPDLSRPSPWRMAGQHRTPIRRTHRITRAYR